ncbi:hypothetical protein [Streptomyces sp. BA2]|uniref:hypothetical protein n=1 Tax=Streptomyces sp. BA2 TaxID=436595 RepID=UPI001328B4D9|nr:hypothetical protein [Streptomyces sp. BA2]MWA07813.1 hypothetical protein [Streptomyces sp. BA2]
MTTTYNAAFSAPAVQTPFDGHSHRAPSLYCLNTAANTYDRYEWSGTKRPWFGDTPDGQGNLVGTAADPGLFGHWDIPWDTVDGTLCVDTKHIYLFNGTTCIYYTLEATGSYTDHTPQTDDVIDPIPISQVFGATYTSDSTTKPPTQSTVFPLPKVDAAFLTANKKIWFFGGNQCYLIDATTHTPEDDFKDNNGKPTALNINATTNAQGNPWTGWTGLPNDLNNGITWAAPTLNSDGTVKDKAHLVTGTEWAPAVPSTKTACVQTYTTPGGPDPTFTVPAGVKQITVELWGPGGGAGDSINGAAHATGGAGGAGAYLRDTFSVDPGNSLSFHVGGAPGDTQSTYYPSGDVKLVAGAGGGGGGAGAQGIPGGDGGGGSGLAGTTTEGYPGGPGGGGIAGGKGGQGGQATVLGNLCARGGDGADTGPAGNPGGNGQDALQHGVGPYGGGGGAGGSNGSAGAGGSAGVGTVPGVVAQAGTSGHGSGGGYGGGGGGGIGAKTEGGGGGGGGGAGGGGGGAGGRCAGNTPGPGGGGGGGGGGGIGAGGYGAGGGGGGAGASLGFGFGGGGGAQGPSLTQASTHFNAGNGPTPAGYSPGGAGTGGSPDSSGPGNPGANGAVRITWTPGE